MPAILLSRLGAGGQDAAIALDRVQTYVVQWRHGGNAMLQTAHTPEETGRLGEAIYQREIRPKVMPNCKGKFLAIDVRSGEYEMDDDLTATRRLQTRIPGAEIYALRIGYRAAYSLAGRLLDEDA
jgi:hypothetical protein